MAPAHDRLLGRVRAHRLLESYALGVAPAAAAGVVGASHLGHPLLALELFAATLAVSLAINASGFPLHLMPVARTVLRCLAPVGGAALVLPLAAYGGHDVQAGAFSSPVLGAWLLTALGAWLAPRFESGSEVRVAVIGEPGLAALLAAELRAAGVQGYRVVGAIDPRPTARRPPVRMEDGFPVLGRLGEMRRIVSRRAIDLLVHQSSPGPHGAAAGAPRLQVFERALRECLDLPVRMVEASQLYEELLGHVPIGAINAAWFQYLLHPRYRSTSTGAKRGADLAIGALAAILSLPLLVAAAVAIRLEDGGAIFHRQRRVGEGGRAFRVLKLRTMREDAEAEGARWSDRGDARITRAGRLLRATHVDELPQLWNVLRGEMTLVGPRPERPEMVEGLEQRIPYYDRRHLVKPGITGWAQVRCGYSGSEFGSAWKLCHDLYYLKHRSLFGDLLIMLETLRVLGHGSQYAVHAPDPRFITGGASAG